MASSSPLHASRLPEELLLHILRHMNEGLTKWETLRQQLHLRLVSTWFGSAWETVSLRNIRVNLHPSISDSVSHLIHLLRNNAKLVENIKALVFTSVEPTKRAKEAVGGLALAYKFHPATAGSEERIQYKQIASLMGICTNLQTLDIRVGPALLAPESALPVGGLQALRSVVLRSTAIIHYLPDLARSFSTESSLGIVPSSIYKYLSDKGIGDLAGLIRALRTDTISLASLCILEATSRFSRNFLARISIRTRTLELGVSSFASFTKLLDIIIRMRFLSTIQEIQFVLTDELRNRAEASQAAYQLDVSKELQRLKAAGPAGLEVTWE